jgi:hypothetical protein
MRVLRHALRQLFVLAAITVSFCSLARAESVFGDGPRWACWYSPVAMSVQCLLSRTPQADHEMRAAQVAATADRRLSTLVRTIWGSPEKLAGDHISIPLMSQPFEMEFVQQLARSVMCGGRPDCSVHFDANIDGMAPVRAAALEAGASEDEVMAEVRAQGLLLAKAEPLVAPRPVKRPRSAVISG